MGSGCSCDDDCNCFTHDKDIKHTTVIHHESSKWIWSNDHDISLTESLVDIPMDIIHLIKHHSFSAKHDYFISIPTICEAKYYSEINKLLSKSLCAKWYAHKMYCLRSISMALIGNNKQSKKQILDIFCDHLQFLPALQLQMTSSDSEQKSSRRTIVIDKCTIPVDLSNIDSEHIDFNTIENTNIFMLILNESDGINIADQLIQTMNDINQSFQNKTCIVVRLCNRKIGYNKDIVSKSQTNQLCRKYNISFFEELLNSDQSMHDLLTFCIKYYWFCDCIN